MVSPTVGLQPDDDIVSVKPSFSLRMSFDDGPIVIDIMLASTSHSPMRIQGTSGMVMVMVMVMAMVMEALPDPIENALELETTRLNMTKISGYVRVGLVFIFMVAVAFREWQLVQPGHELL